MTAHRRTRITIETERVLLLLRRQTSRGWCERCGQEVDLVAVEQARNVLEGIPFEGKSDTQFHLERAREGLAVCVKSLLQVVKGARGQ